MMLSMRKIKVLKKNEKTDINHDITDDYIKEDAPK